MTFTSDSNSKAFEQYLQWRDDGCPNQDPDHEVVAMQTQLQGMIVNLRPHKQQAMFRLMKQLAIRELQESDFSDPVADVVPEPESNDHHVYWTVSADHDIYMSTENLVVGKTQNVLRSRDLKLLCAVNLGLVRLVRNKSNLHSITNTASMYRTAISS